MFSSPITRIPNESELHHWADYLELLCMTDLDGQFSAQRLADLVGFASDLQATSPDAQDIEEADVELRLIDDLTEDLASIQGSVDPALEDHEGENDDDGLVEVMGFGRAAEGTENRYLWCQNNFRLLADRARSLGESYPFTVDLERLTIERRELTEETKGYVFLLCCSLLPYVSGKVTQRLTQQFEIAAYGVLKTILPNTAVVDLYGTARWELPSVFTGSLFDRIKALAAALGARLIVSECDFNPKDHGDNGLDLVAWIPMHDTKKGVPSFFAQCACGRNWEAKQYEASYERWREFMHLTSPCTKITFVSHYFRGLGEDWYAESEVSGIVIDRLRMLRCSPGLQSVPDELVRDAWRFRQPEA